MKILRLKYLLFLVFISLLPAQVLAGGPSSTITAISDPMVLEGDAGTTAVQFEITCQCDLAVNAIVNWQLNDGTATTADSDYVDASGSFDVVGGTGLETYFVNASINGDLDMEPDETFVLELTGASVGSPSFVIADDMGTATILNDDVAQPDIALSSTESADPVTAGSGVGNMTYVVTATNSGTLDATGVEVSATVMFPAGTTIDSAVASGTGSWSNTQPGTWTIGNLAQGASETLTFVLTVGASTAAGAQTTLVASVSEVTEGDSNDANDATSEDTTVTRSSDLSVEKTDSPDPVIAGENLTYTVTVSNAGPSDAANVVATDTLPAGTTFGSTSGCAEDPNGVPTCTLGTIAAGASAQYTIIVTVDSDVADGANLSNLVSVASDSSDPVNNNEATEDTTVQREVDITVTKMESIDPVVAGSGAGNLVYIITAANNGPSDITGATFTENLVLPASVSVDSVVPSTGATGGSSPNFTWTGVDIAAGTSETLTVTLTAASSAVVGTDTISDTATLTGSTGGETITDTDDDSATESTSVFREVDITVSKTESIDPVVAGSGPGNLTYVVTALNNGPSDVTALAISEAIVVPANVTVNSVTPSAGSWVDPTWTVDLAAGASATLTIVITVPLTADEGTDVISDSAQVSGSGGNEDIIETGDDAASEATSIRWPIATFNVFKLYTEGMGPPVQVSLDCTDSSGLAFGDPGNGISDTTLVWRRFDLLAPGASCSVVEVVPDFYYEFERSAECDVDPLADEAVYNCTITNAPSFATFHVTKDFVPDASREVEVFISCNDGLPLNSDQVITEESGGVTFIVELFIATNLECEIVEVPIPAGYDVNYVASIVEGEANAQSFDNSCLFSEVVSGDFLCEITDTAQPAIFEVDKVWNLIGQGGDNIRQEMNLSISCTQEILSASPTPYFGPGEVQNRSLVRWLGLEGDTTVSVTVDTSNGTARCRARERVFSDAVEIDNPCRNDRSLTMGQTSYCTITNTVFFEGIPTLNQYGLALLALLMLGIGAVGLRRFV